MATLNRSAAEAAAAVGITAATDVTGFSLLGHAIEMAEGAGLGLDLSMNAVPVLDGALDTLAAGIAPGATRRNLAHFGSDVTWGNGITETQRLLLGDPQTSGGLLLAVDPTKVDALLQALSDAGTLAAAVVGTLSAQSGVRVS
jgi:selenide,water dikinase